MTPEGGRPARPPSLPSAHGIRPRLPLDGMPSGWRTLAAAIAAAGCTAPPPPTPLLTHQVSGTDVLLQAISVVDRNVVWVSGHGATYARTTDGGTTWHAAHVPGPDSLQFRDVHAVDANTAYLLSAGSGDMSRIYHTTDAGKSWELQFVNDDPSAFFDCFDFWTPTEGVAFSDAVQGQVVILRTEDGRRWNPLDPTTLPPAAGTEGAFAASGTCLVVAGDSSAWIGTGAGEAARIYRTADRGRHWTVHSTPVIGGTPTTGIATLVASGRGRGMAMGGDIGTADRHDNNVAVTGDGGVTWTLASPTGIPGAVYGSSAVPGLDDAVVAVGPGGIDLTWDYGRTWTTLDPASHWAVGFADQGAGWAVGPAGRITRIVLR